jgi:acetyl esterase/lipase
MNARMTDSSSHRPLNRRELFQQGAAGALAPAAAGGAEAPPSASSNPSAAEWRLWSDEAPGSPADPVAETMIEETPSRHGDPGIFTSVRWPSLFVYPSRRPNGAALLMAPGGAFARVAIGAGSGDIARRFNMAGVCVFMLKYRLPSGRWSAGVDTSLQDAQRAVRWIRARAAQFDVDRNKVGVIGFSAGGFVAASLATRFAEHVYDHGGSVDDESARPDFAALVSPVIALDRPFAHAGVREALLGGAAREEGTRASPDLHASAAMPPTFLAHAVDDPVVSVENALAMFAALRAAQAAVEAHLFERGGHSLASTALGSSGNWLALFLDWAAAHGFVESGPARSCR